MQRLLLLLVIGSLAGAAWLIAGGLPASDKTDEGLVVHVFVADRAGKPVAPAQIIQAYDQKRTLTDGEGYVRLTHVTLRADEEPSPEALSVALKPLTRFHAPRRGFAPTVRKRDDGSWEVRYALHAHGILRVHVESVALGKSKAFLEPDLPLQRWEPVGGHQVVRPGSVVDFRIYEGWTKVPLSFEGEPGPDGVPTVATQRLLVDAPSPGHTAQVRIIPEPVDPIAGVVRVSKGPTPPTLRGRIVVRKVADDASKVEISETPIDDEGGFVVRDAGTGTYELTAHLDFVASTTTVQTQGGEYVEVEVAGQARWAIVEHPDFKATGSGIYFRSRHGAAAAMGRLEERLSEDRLSAQLGEDRSAVALPPGGVLGLDCFVAGSQSKPPLRGACTFDAPEQGAVHSSVQLKAAPHFALRVTVSPEAWGKARSATIRVGTRRASLVRGAKEQVLLKHLLRPPAGFASSVEVLVAWDDPDAVLGRYLVEAGGDERELALTVDLVRGGGIAIHGTGPHAATWAGSMYALLHRRAPDSDGLQEVILTRADARPVWGAPHPLAPGRYTMNFSVPQSPDGPRRSTAVAESFTIVAGETTTLSLVIEPK